MKWSKKGIDKPVEKINSTVGARFLGIVRRFKLSMLPENIKVHTFGPIDYQAITLSQIAFQETECRKAEVLTLIRRASFI